MASPVVNGAMCQCSFGAAAPLIVEPENRTMINDQPAATIMDYVLGKNIPTFGECSSPTNPAVIAATAAKLGVFTPVPCTPVIAAPWVPGAPKVLINNQPALTQCSTCVCTCGGGTITISQPAQVTAQTTA